jgi:hypothetical protein
MEYLSDILATEYPRVSWETENAYGGKPIHPVNGAVWVQLVKDARELNAKHHMALRDYGEYDEYVKVRNNEAKLERLLKRNRAFRNAYILHEKSHADWMAVQRVYDICRDASRRAKLYK